MSAQIIQIRDPHNVAPEVLEAISRTLEKGDIVVHPTHTVMGMAVDTENRRALTKLFRAKKRSSDGNPAISLCRSSAVARQLVNFPPAAEKLAAAFWPGPLTLVLPARSNTDNHFLVKDGFRAVRVPSDPYSRMIIENYPHPITSTSTNRNGDPSINNAASVLKEFQDEVALIIDGQYGQVSLSTMVKCDNQGIKILREGAIPEKQILECLSE